MFVKMNNLPQLLSENSSYVTQQLAIFDPPHFFSPLSLS